MIYTITEFTKITTDKVSGFPTFGDRRCIGYFEDITKALLYVAQRHYSTPYIIVEEVPEGVYRPTLNRYLYAWDENHYKRIREPKLLNIVTNFGIG